MKMNYARINPSGNITLLVTDSVSRRMQKDVAQQLMRMDAGSEQVGFLEAAAAPGAALRLQMMGGEFCGNATMSAAAWMAWKQGLKDGEEALYHLEVSGAQDVIPCRIHREGDTFIGTVPMPLPREIAQLEIFPGVRVPLVRFEGIDHAVVNEGLLSPERADQIIAPLCAELDADALGILLFNPETNAMRPLVYVRSTDSAVWENSCGSGSAAIGVWQASLQAGDADIHVGQPCPDTWLGVFAGWQDGWISRLEITGRVRVEKETAAEIEE